MIIIPIFADGPAMKSSIVPVLCPTHRRLHHHVVIAGHHTGMALEAAFWRALRDIAVREGTTVDALCTDINRRRSSTTLPASVRVFVVSYYRQATPALQTNSASDSAALSQDLLKEALEAMIQPDTPTSWKHH